MIRGSVICIASFVLAAASIGCGSDKDPQTPPPLGVGRLAACDESGAACTWAGLKGENGFNGDGHHRLDTKLSQVQDLLFLDDGTAWLSDFNNFLIRKVLPDETVESVVGTTKPIFPGDGPLGGAGPEGAPGAEWSLNHPTNLLEGDTGEVLLVGWHNHKLLSIDRDTGWVKVVSGSGAGFAGDGGPATCVSFRASCAGPPYWKRERSSP